MSPCQGEDRGFDSLRPLKKLISGSSSGRTEAFGAFNLGSNPSPEANMNQKQVQNRVLGELESKIMEIIWRQKGAISVKEVAEILSKKRQIAYTTVMTIMSRLVDKGVLVRHLSGLSYLYKSKVGKEQFIAKTVHGIFSSAVSILGEEALTHFVKEIQKINPKKRRELLEILGED